MKVYLGPFRKWWGPYQIAGLLKYVGISEDRCHAAGKWLADTWLDDFCSWVENRRGRTEKIRIDYYDVWSADHTLALIIAPMLRRLKEQNHGSPRVEDEDVPEHLRSTVAPPTKDWGETDGKWHERWDWIMDELIWTFDQIARSEPDEPRISADKPGWEAYNARLDNGLRLFGRYYRGLWD